MPSKSEENLSDEVAQLRRTLRDLVAFSALPAIWTSYEPDRVAASLAEAVTRSLSLDFVHVSFPHRPQGRRYEILSRNDQLPPGQEVSSVSEILDELIRDPFSRIGSIANPLGEGSLNVCVTRFGVGPDAGVMVAASRRDGFPTGDERLLLGVAANQAAIAIRGQRAAESKGVLAAIVESSQDAVISRTLDGVITSWNQGAERLFGYTAAETIGRTVHLLLPPDRQFEDEQLIERQRRGEQIEPYETVRLHKNGTRLDISLTVSPIRDGTGRIIGISKISRNITEQKRAERERAQLLESERAARSEAEHAARMRDEFLATVSHELRTPLNGVLGWIQLLRRCPDDAATRTEALDAIERGARAQARLIEDILDMSRIVSGKLRLDVQTVALPSIIQAAIETIRPAAEAKSIQIERLMDPAGGSIKGDPARLQQVMWNLLSNAIKFTARDGRIQIHVERVGSHIEISVSDSGRGISPEFLPHVFDRFRQADGSTRRQQGGLGLGLALVKHIVELHGGKVVAKSPGEGLGATFTVHLPIALMSAETTSEEHPSSSQMDHHEFDESRLTDARILVVDDDVDTCEMLRRVLKERGAQVEIVASAREAMVRIDQMRPQILISDIGMPEMDGYDLIREVRAAGHRMSAIAVTAFARAEDRIRSLRAGFNMHLSKPLEPQELIEMISTLIKSASISASAD
jgi:PAS domain S-box-containing protein